MILAVNVAEQIDSKKERQREKNKHYYALNRQREIDRCRAYHRANREKILANDRQYYTANSQSIRRKANLARLVDPEKTSAQDKVSNQKRRLYHLEYRQRNSGQVALYGAAWSKVNADKKRASLAKRRSLKLKAVPPWADMSSVRNFYREAARLTRETGIRHEVDHIFPLQSPVVCGLHWEGNLQILTRSANRRKLNKLLPELA